MSSDCRNICCIVGSVVVDATADGAEELFQSLIIGLRGGSMDAKSYEDIQRWSVCGIGILNRAQR
jgi:hypothetical protein